MPLCSHWFPFSGSFSHISSDLVAVLSSPGLNCLVFSLLTFVTHFIPSSLGLKHIKRFLQKLLPALCHTTSDSKFVFKSGKFTSNRAIEPESERGGGWAGVWVCGATAFCKLYKVKSAKIFSVPI